MSLVTSMSHSSTTTSRSVCHSSKACQLHHRPRHVASRSLPPHIIDTAAHTTVAVLPANTIADLASAAPSTAEAAAQVPVAVSTYTPGPVEVGWQIWFAAAVSTVPFVIGAYEFGKRIVSPIHSVPQNCVFDRLQISSAAHLTLHMCRYDALVDGIGTWLRVVE